MGSLAAILVSSSQHASALMSRAGIDGSVLTFSDDEPLLAIAAIIERRPSLVVLERFFAATPRGAALINRIKTDAELTDTVIRVLAHDSGYSRVIPRQRAAGTAATPAPASEPVTPTTAPHPSLDATGTRIAPRIHLRPGTQLQLGSTRVAIVDLSQSGAQVISSHALKPNDQFDASLSNEHDAQHFVARVVWASFEAPGGQTQYRAGLAFSGVDPGWLDKFCTEHRHT